MHMSGKWKRIIPVLTSLFMIACTGGNEPEQKETWDLAGKTFYNTVDEYDNLDHARVWFGKDGSFVLTDDFYDGYYEMSGTWSISENVITLNVEKTGVGNYEKVLFEIQDEDTIVLKTMIAGSKSDDVFTTTKPVTDGSGKTNNEPHGTVEWKKDFTITDGHNKYYNTTSHGLDPSYIDLYDDGSFLFVDVVGMGAEQIVGTYGQEGDVLMFSNFTNKFYDWNGEEVYNMEMRIIDNDTLVLMVDLQGSMTGDVFTTSGELPEGLDTWTVHKIFTHTPIEGTPEAFLPTLELNKDGTFVFTENVYAGMAHYRGTWTETAGGYIVCDATDNKELQGFAGQGVETIIFEYAEPNTLMLNTDLCMSLKGDTFNLSIVE